tara:strand:+ start:9185 stop:9844 length:660 start_codon:yes stop_codon:yes gene_type:complete
MKPKYPLTQKFQDLPDEIPIFTLENALLPGGELPLELSSNEELDLFIGALRTDQLIGMIQPDKHNDITQMYRIGCAGRIRQYRERKDGRINIMLTGICRYKIVEVNKAATFPMARVDWSDFAKDYEVEALDHKSVKSFKESLLNYFKRHNMAVDWDVLDNLPIEQLVNNLILVVNLEIKNKQKLLEAATLGERLILFSDILRSKEEPILSSVPPSTSVN